MRYTFFESLNLLRVVGIVLSLVLGATLLPSDSAVAAQVARECVCESGSGGCQSGFAFCCDDFTKPDCGCVFIWHESTGCKTEEEEP